MEMAGNQPASEWHGLVENPQRQIACNLLGETLEELVHEDQKAVKPWSCCVGLGRWCTIGHKMRILPFDSSKQLHPKMVGLFAPLVPGIFFVVLITSAGTSPHWKLAAAPSPFWDYLGQLVLGLLFAYFIGLIAIYCVGLVRTVFRLISLRFAQFLPKFKQRLCDLRGRSGRFLGWIVGCLLLPVTNYFLEKNQAHEYSAQAAYQVWVAAASRLLRARYGIAAPDGPNASDEWRVWRVVWGKPSEPELYGAILHASGWLGLLASCIVPSLWNRAYLIFVGALIVLGIINDLVLAHTWGSQFLDTIQRTRHVLSEIPQQQSEAHREREDLSEQSPAISAGSSNGVSVFLSTRS